MTTILTMHLISILGIIKVNIIILPRQCISWTYWHDAYISFEILCIMHKLLNWTRRLCLSNAQNTHHVRSPFSYTLSHKWLLVPPEVVLHRRTHTDFSSYVQYPIEMFNSHKIKLHVPLYHLSPFMKVFDWIVTILNVQRSLTNRI